METSTYKLKFTSCGLEASAQKRFCGSFRLDLQFSIFGSGCSATQFWLGNTSFGTLAQELKPRNLVLDLDFVIIAWEPRLNSSFRPLAEKVWLRSLAEELSQHQTASSSLPGKQAISQPTDQSDPAYGNLCLAAVRNPPNIHQRKPGSNKWAS